MLPGRLPLLGGKGLPEALHDDVHHGAYGVVDAGDGDGVPGAPVRVREGHERVHGDAELDAVHLVLREETPVERGVGAVVVGVASEDLLGDGEADLDDPGPVLREVGLEPVDVIRQVREGASRVPADGHGVPGTVHEGHLAGARSGFDDLRPGCGTRSLGVDAIVGDCAGLEGTGDLVDHAADDPARSAFEDDEDGDAFLGDEVLGLHKLVGKLVGDY